MVRTSGTTMRPSVERRSCSTWTISIATPHSTLVCEGVFDALMFDGIAILGSKLTPAKFELLKHSRRRLVFVIDKDKNGRSLAETVLNAGWEITFAPDGAEDINRSVQRFGRAWTAQQLMMNIPMNETAAQLALGFNCT
jgi:DNA primase